jgi:large subunit ribosomal protein L24e
MTGASLPQRSRKSDRGEGEGKGRLAGQLAWARKRGTVVATGEHLIRKELRAREQGLPLAAGMERVTGKVLRQKKKTRLLVGGGTEEEMDID